MEEQVANRASAIAGHWDEYFAGRFGADDHNGFSILVLNGSDVQGVHQPLAMDAQKLTAQRRFDGCQR